MKDLSIWNFAPPAKFFFQIYTQAIPATGFVNLVALWRFRTLLAYEEVRRVDMLSSGCAGCTLVNDSQPFTACPYGTVYQFNTAQCTN